VLYYTMFSIYFQLLKKEITNHYERKNKETKYRNNPLRNGKTDPH